MIAFEATDESVQGVWRVFIAITHQVAKTRRHDRSSLLPDWLKPLSASNKTFITHLAGFACFNLARALRNLERYCIILVRTLKHLKPAKCVINITNCTHIFIMTFHNKNLFAHFYYDMSYDIYTHIFIMKYKLHPHYDI